jgi:hypothetical protein
LAGLEAGPDAIVRKGDLGGACTSSSG